MNLSLPGWAKIRVYVIVISGPVLLLGPALVTGRVLFWGTPALQFVPWWQMALDSLSQGVLPLWNPLNGMGAPLLANYQTAFFYPPNLLLLGLGALAGTENSAAYLAWGYTFLGMLHLAWAGIGMAALLRRLKVGWLAQAIGGLAFGLSGYTVVRLGFFSMVWVAAWLPWIIYFADHLASLRPGGVYENERKVDALPGLILCLGMQLLAGHAQLTWYTMLLAFAWVTAGALQTKQWRELLRTWALFGAAALAAAGLAAIQLVPTFEYLQQSFRADAVSLDVALVYSYWPWRLLTLFAPDFYGSPASGNFWGYASYWEDHLYLGMLPLLMALATLVLLLRGIFSKRRSEYQGILVFHWAGMVITFVMAMGRYTPVFPLLYQYAPTFDMFQAPTRYLIWVTFAIALLSAVAIDRWRCPTGRGLYWFRLATAGTFAVTLGAGLGSIFLQDVRLTFIRASALAGVWALGCGLLTLAIPWAEKNSRRGLWQGVVFLWVLADLLITGWSLNPTLDMAFFKAQDIQGAARLAVEKGERVYISEREEYDLKFLRFLRFSDFAPLVDWGTLRTVMLPDLNLLEGLGLVNNFDPLVPDVYARWLAALGSQPVEAQESWLAWSGVGLVERIDMREKDGVRFDAIEGAQRWNWSPCAQFVAVPSKAWDMLAAEMNQPVRPGREIILESLQPTESELNCGAPTEAVPTDLPFVKVGMDSRPDRVTLEVDAAKDGWLELMDTWYPGWTVSVDGQAAALYRADGAFRAVPVLAGSHRIVFQYRPIGFYFGGLFSILVLLFIIIWGMRRKGVLSLKSTIT